MNNIILEKKNGIVEEVIREKALTQHPYITEEENCFSKEIDVKKKTVSNDDIKLLKRQINKILSIVTKLEPDFIKNVYSMIKSAQSKKDLEFICSYFLKKYIATLNIRLTREDKVKKEKTINDIREKASNSIKKNFDIFLSVFIKALIKDYYLRILILCSQDRLYELYKLEREKKDVSILFDKIGENFDYIAEKNGVKNLSSKLFLNVIYDVYDKRQIHMCWENCENATPDKCLKIADIKKKKIDKYDFIIDGYQVLDSKGDIESFIVTNCKKYKKQVNKKLTKEELQRIRNFKESIMSYYFDAVDKDEAKAIKSYLEKTGQIYEYNGVKK